jgi:hypothetical protein
MEKRISSETESDLTKLGLYQIVGGAVGILILLWSLYKTESIASISIFLTLLISIFFGFSIYCGILCIKSKDKALSLSLMNQFLQLIGFAVFGFAFKYVAGVSLTIGLDLTESLKFGFAIGVSKFQLSINRDPDLFQFDFNLIALVVIYWTDKLLKKFNSEKALREASSIGES